jgi:hypothetical protein
MQMQMFNAFKDVCPAASGSVRLNLLNEEYPDRMSCDEFYDCLEKPWNVRIPEYGKIKELYKVGAQIHNSQVTGCPTRPGDGSSSPWCTIKEC